jgi:hypothetical protein
MSVAGCPRTRQRRTGQSARALLRRTKDSDHMPSLPALVRHAAPARVPGSRHPPKIRTRARAPVTQSLLEPARKAADPPRRGSRCRHVPSVKTTPRSSFIAGGRQRLRIAFSASRASPSVSRIFSTRSAYATISAVGDGAIRSVTCTATCTERPSQHPSAAKDTARRAFPVEPTPGAVVVIRPRATCSYQTGSRGMGFRPRRPCRNTSKRPG